MTESEDFVELYRVHYPSVVAALGLAGADHGQAQDLGQEAFALTYRRWRRVRTGTNPAGYVYTVAFRLLRRQVERWDDSLHDDDAVVPGHEEATVDALSVTRTIASMPTRRRACATLCFYLGFSGTEAARILGIEASTVRVQLRRARADLAVALREEKPALVE